MDLIGEGVALTASECATGIVGIGEAPARMGWQIRLSGGVAVLKSCERCGAPLDRGSSYSGALEIMNAEGVTFFRGCVRCLESSLAPVTSAR